MKRKKDFVYREIADDHIVVPLCAEADRLQGILSLSPSGALLWEKLKSAQTEQSLTSVLCEEYEISREAALADVRAFLKAVDQLGCLVK